MRRKNSTATEQQGAHEATLDTLRKAFERSAPGFRLASQGTRASITASINHLAKLAGIEKGKQTRAELYDEATRILSGQRIVPGGIEYVQHLCADIRREWERNPLRPERVARLKQRWYTTANTLGRALGDGYKGWNEYTLTTDEEREEIRREITALADESGIQHAEMGFEQAYIEAVKNLGGTDKGSPHGERLRAIAAEIQERDREHYRQQREAESSTPRSPRSIIVRKPTTRARNFAVTMSEEMGHVGFARGEIVELEETDDLKPLDICAVEEKGDDSRYFGRVVVISSESLTYRLDEGQEWTTPRTQIAKLYRVNPEPIGRADDLTDEQREELKTLRKKLDKLAEEDDQIIRCSARYEIEKKIFEIEHPAGGDPNDWSAWEVTEDDREAAAA